MLTLNKSSAGVFGNNAGASMFVSAKPVDDARRRALVIASVGAHIAVGIGLFGYSLFHIEEIAPPQISLTFFSAPPPPPPPPPPAGSKTKSTPKVETKPTESKLIQPTDVKPQPKTPEPAGEVGGVVGGVKGGVAGGVVGGVVGGVLSDQAPAKMVAGFTLAAQQLQHTDPRLPDWFLNQHAQQTVKGTYKVCIRNDGHISDVTAMNGIPAVDDLIIQQIKANWLYKPQAVPVCTASVLIFKIK